MKIKTFIKLAALAVIVSMIGFAAVSCDDPSASLTKMNYDQWNKQFDPAVQTSVAHKGFQIIQTDLGYNPSNSINYSQEVVILFDETADCLKKDDAGLISDMSSFLKFYTVGKTPDAAGTEKDYVTPDSLLTLIPYTLVTRVDDKTINGAYVVIKLKDNYGEKESDRIAFKFESANYTFNNGAKWDRDGNGVPAEPFYDDFWNSFTIGTTPEAGDNHYFFPAGNQGWMINISLPSQFEGSFTSPFTSVDVTVAQPTSSWTYRNATSDENETMRNNILNGLASKFTVEKRAPDGSWGSSGLTVTYDKDLNIFKASSFSPDNKTAYRVVYTGDTIFEYTTTKYYGGNQRIYVVNDYNPPLSYGTINKHEPGTLKTDAGFRWNSGTQTYDHTFNSNTTLYYSDIKGRNAVIKLTVPTPIIVTPGATTNYYYLKDNAAVFKDNFKIVLAQPGLNLTSFQSLSTNSYVFVDYEVKLAKSKRLENRSLSANLAANTAVYGVDEITITLDKNIDVRDINSQLYFYYNDKIVMANDTATFGNSDNWINGFYNFTGPINFYGATDTTLPPGVGGDVVYDYGSATISSDAGDTIYFLATGSGTVYLHFFYDLSTVDNVDVYIEDDSSNPVANGNLYSYVTYMSFTVTEGVWYNITVTPYSSGDTGYSIFALTNSSSTPPYPPI